MSTTERDSGRLSLTWSGLGEAPAKNEIGIDRPQFTLLSIVRSLVAVLRYFLGISDSGAPAWVGPATVTLPAPRPVAAGYKQ